MPSEKELKSRAEHDKWLMKMGAHPTRSKTRSQVLIRFQITKHIKALQVVVII